MDGRLADRARPGAGRDVTSSPAARTVVIVDDHPIASESLEGRLREAGFAVLPGVTAVEGLDGRARADVVVCDLRLPGRSGADAVGHLSAQGCRVLATSGVATAEEVLDVVAAGALGFIAKTAAPAKFVRAVAEVAGGAHHLSAELAHYLRTDADRRPLPSGDIGGMERDVLRCFEQGDSTDEVAHGLGVPPDRLEWLLGNIWRAAVGRRQRLMPTARERDVMRLVAQGLTHREVAAALAVATYTVPDYLKSIKAKYLAAHPEAPGEVAPLTAARLWARELGLT